jgi:hypothetical protein
MPADMAYKAFHDDALFNKETDDGVDDHFKKIESTLPMCP